MKALVLSCLIAFAFWFLMFSPFTAGCFNFWLTMSLAALILTFLSWHNQRGDLKKILQFKVQDFFIGIVSALVLYGIFFLGRVVLIKILPFGESEIMAVYSTREQASPLIIAFILLFLIGPAEEIFWRGFIQQRLVKQFGKVKGLGIAALIYTLVHIWSFSLTLLVASLVCGLFWGFIFLKTERLWPVIISHALWDLLIFVVIPLQ